MTTPFNPALIEKFGHPFLLSTIKKNAILPFKDHPAFSFITDILSRKYQHHALLITNVSAFVRTTFLQAFLLQLTHEHTPEPLRQAPLLFIDFQSLTENDFQALLSALTSSQHYVIIATTDATPTTYQEKLLLHPQCRFLLFHPHEVSPETYTSVSLPALTDADKLIILKLQRHELEQFHQVIIADDVLAQAYQLAERFLSVASPLEKALLLLDSSAARANHHEHPERTPTSKPVVTLPLLLQTLSSWTAIPSSHLSLGKNKFVDFNQAMRERLFGQETALTLLAEQLQLAQAELTQHTGPYAHFLFAGPAHAGKKTAALALTEQLFKQLNPLYFGTLDHTVESLLTLTLKNCVDHTVIPLQEVLKKTPFAVIFLENCEAATTNVLTQLKEIILTGRWEDGAKHYLFQQTTLILSTQLNTAFLTTLSKQVEPAENNHLDLFNFLMNDAGQKAQGSPFNITPEEIIHEIKPDLLAIFPSELCQHIIPFVPLAKPAIEKIIRQKLKILGKQLDTRYGVELGYAPEVIKYLTEFNFISVDTTLKQLYLTIEQALAYQQEAKHASNQLFLQLNETGERLRSDWVKQTVTH